MKVLLIFKLRKTQSSTRDTKHPDATLQSHEQENRTLSTKSKDLNITKPNSINTMQ